MERIDRIRNNIGKTVKELNRMDRIDSFRKVTKIH
jgi:hypothetical protein